MEDAVLAVLGQDSRRDIGRGVGLNDDVAIEVEVGENGCRGEPSLKFLEGELLVLVPVESLVLPGEFREGSYGGGETMNEPSVLVRES